MHQNMGLNPWFLCAKFCIVVLKRQAQPDSDQLNKRESNQSPMWRSRSVSRIKSWIGELDQNSDLIVTGMPLEAYDPSLVRRHTFWDSMLVARTSIEVHVSTSVIPFKDMYKKCYVGHCMYRVIFWNWVHVVLLSLSLPYLLYTLYVFWSLH